MWVLSRNLTSHNYFWKVLSYFDEYFPGYGWFPNESVDPTQTYKFNSQAEGSVSITGEPVSLETAIPIAEDGIGFHICHRS